LSFGTSLSPTPAFFPDSWGNKDESRLFLLNGWNFVCAFLKIVLSFSLGVLVHSHFPSAAPGRHELITRDSFNPAIEPRSLNLFIGGKVQRFGGWDSFLDQSANEERQLCASVQCIRPVDQVNRTRP
jgi:hypothetical protein